MTKEQFLLHVKKHLVRSGNDVVRFLFECEVHPDDIDWFYEKYFEFCKYAVNTANDCSSLTDFIGFILITEYKEKIPKL